MKTKASRNISKTQRSSQAAPRPSHLVTEIKSWWKELWSSHKVLLIILAGVLCLYSPILGKQFEQDEWFDTGSNQIYLAATTPFPLSAVKAFFSPQPITQLFNFLSYYFFGVQNLVFSITVLVLVLVNSTLWYSLVFKLTKSKLVAAGSLLFAVFSLPAQQAITWSQPAVAYQIAFLFILLCLMAFNTYITTNQKKYIGIALGCAIVSMLTRYNSFFIFVLVALMAVLFKWQDFSQKTRRSFWTAAALFGVFSIYLLVAQPSYELIQERFIHSRTQGLLNIFILPLKTVSILLSTRFIYLTTLAQNIVIRYYMIISPSGRELTVISEWLAIIITLVVSLFYWLTSKFSKESLKRVLFFAFFYALTFAPYIFDKFSTATQSLESRYLFIPAFALGALIFLWVENVVQRLAERPQWLAKLFQLGVVLLTVTYLVHNAYFILTWELAYNQVTQKRIEVLRFARERYVVNNDGDMILFIQDINTPLSTATNVTGTLYQTGFMYPFLVYSYQTGRIPYQVFEDRTFWNMNYQGAKEVAGRKFGLFYEYDELQKYVLEHKIPPRSIYALQVDYGQVDQNKAKIFPIFVFADVKYEDITKTVRSNLRYE